MTDLFLQAVEAPRPHGSEDEPGRSISRSRKRASRGVPTSFSSDKEAGSGQL